MMEKAYAKINISLDIVGKREDGYHLLSTIMQNIDLYDEISLRKREEGIKIICDREDLPLDDNNIAYKAAELFIKEFNLKQGVEIKINKNIPVGAGLAGGSTDAAAVLKIMNEMFNINASQEKLMEIGVKIGADVPFCIKGGIAHCEGIGEKVSSLKSFNNKILVLVKPSFSVSTKETYKKLRLNCIKEHPNIEKIVECINDDNIKDVCENMKNVLEEVVIEENEEIKEIKNNMIKLGGMGTLMSGSGPSVFGFFEDMLKAQRAYEYFKNIYEEVFITITL